MPTLRDILTNLNTLQTHGDTGAAINSLHIDSRRVDNGSAFIAVQGTLSDGHAFIEKAVELGARAIVCETLPEELKAGVTYVQVKDSAGQ